MIVVFDVSDRRLWSALLIAAICGGVLCPTFVTAADARTWTDATGAFEIEAEFLSEKEGTVTLKQTDGTEMEIELKQLSQADQQFVADLKKKAMSSPFKKKSASPFKKRTDSDPPAANAAASGDPGEPIKPDWSNLRFVNLTPRHATWKLELPAPPESQLQGRPRPIAIPQKRDFFEGVNGFAANDKAQRIVVGYELGRGKDPGSTRLVLADLADQKVVGKAEMPGKFLPMSLAEDGQTILMKKNVWGFGNQDTVELWRLQGSRVSRLKAVIPHHDVDGPDRDVKWGAFLGGNRAATMSSRGKLAIWDSETLEPIYGMEVNGWCVPAVYPGGQFIALVASDSIQIVDPHEGEVVVSRPMPEERMNQPKVTFSPSGKVLFMTASNNVYALDMTTGEFISQFMSADTIFGTNTFEGVSDTHVMVDRGVLFDTQEKIALWQYDGFERFAMVDGTGWFLVKAGHRDVGAIIPLDVPHRVVTQRLEQAKHDPNFLVLAPDTTVKLDTSGIGDSVKRAEVTKQLSGKLDEQGFQVADNGSITLRASVTNTGKTREVSYSFSRFGGPIGFGSGDHKHTFPLYVSRVEFVYDGHVAWSREANNIPSSLQMDDNKSFREVASKHEKPNYGLFQSVSLPERLLKPTGASTLGVTQITTKGVVEKNLTPQQAAPKNPPTRSRRPVRF